MTAERKNLSQPAALWRAAESAAAAAKLSLSEWIARQIIRGLPAEQRKQLPERRRAGRQKLMFRSENKMFSVSFSGGIIAELASVCNKSPELETGGILIGRYSKDHTTAIVEQVSGPPPDSQHHFATFFRGTRGLQDLLNLLWSKPKKSYYLGEWHYHPLPILTPSAADIEQMKQIAASKEYACPEPILVIVAAPLTPECKLSVSICHASGEIVTLFAEPSE